MASADVCETIRAVQPSVPDTIIIPADCRQGMRLCLAPQSVHMVVTSPPYFGLRDYDHGGQLGQEETPEEYVAALVDVFREIWRVLRDDGTVWLNLGDSYCNRGHAKSSSGNGTSTLTGGAQEHHPLLRENKGPGLKNKDMIGIPWMVAFALRAAGWYLRQDLIWAKPNPMPESVTDRCTKAHEYIFLLTKSPRYFYDHVAIMEGVAADTVARAARGRSDSHKWADGGPGNQTLAKVASSAGRRRGVPPYHAQYESSDQSGLDAVPRGNGRNRRSVWTVAPKPFKGAHFATFPPDLIEPCILAGSPTACCGQCGAPRVPIYKKTPMVIDRSDRADKSGLRYMTSSQMISPATVMLRGHAPSCHCTGGGQYSSHRAGSVRRRRHHRSGGPTTRPVQRLIRYQRGLLRNGGESSPTRPRSAAGG